MLEAQIGLLVVTSLLEVTLAKCKKVNFHTTNQLDRTILKKPSDIRSVGMLDYRYGACLIS